MAKKQERVVGQCNLLSGEVEGLDKLVEKPQVLEHQNLKVVLLVVPEEEQSVPKYTETALVLARRLLPDIKSRERPPWLQQGWQVKRRKKKAGIT